MTTTTDHLYIVRHPQILGGEPIIKGTRTPVRAIVEMRRRGVRPEEVPQRLPLLRPSACLAMIPPPQPGIH